MILFSSNNMCIYLTNIGSICSQSTFWCTGAQFVLSGWFMEDSWKMLCKVLRFNSFWVLSIFPRKNKVMDYVIHTSPSTQNILLKWAFEFYTLDDCCTVSIRTISTPRRRKWISMGNFMHRIANIMPRGPSYSAAWSIISRSYRAPGKHDP